MTVAADLPGAAAGAVPRHHAVFHRLRVAAVERLTDDAVAITFDVPDDLLDAYRFAPGQHVTIRMPHEADDVRRNYSICASAVSGPLRVAVKRLPGGVFSTYAVESLRPGDELDVMTPTGRFTPRLDPAHRKHYAAIAAGSGITPVLSILSTVLEVEPGSRCSLIYGNRTTSSVMFLEELEDLKDRYPARLSLVHVLSREPHEVELFHGRIDRGRLARLLDTLVPVDTVDEWFLCGPFDLVQEARATLADLGADPAHVHQELFHVEAAPPRPREGAPVASDTAEGSSAVTIVLDGRATTFELARDGEPVLEAALRARSDAPYACKGGVCGTCRAKVLEGRVDMERNFALERDEIAAGFVLACQSHPTTRRVVLDFDA